MEFCSNKILQLDLLKYSHLTLMVEKLTNYLIIHMNYFSCFDLSQMQCNYFTMFTPCLSIPVETAQRFG